MLDAVAKHSRQMIRDGSKSFSAAARFFDAGTRASVYMLYAWCRYCDDQIDGQTLGHYDDGPGSSTEARARLAELYEKTQLALTGKASDEPVFIALQRVVQQHEIPERYPLELLEGFAMDVDGQRYLELDDTLRYCYHVAGVVGVMMSHVMGVREQETLHRAADLGIAFQLTNIARDVTEDASLDRVYLPSSWLEDAGIPPGELLQPSHRSALWNVVRRLLSEAERYYQSAGSGMPALPLRCAWAIATARGVYRNIGHLVLARGKSAWDKRAIVSRKRKLYWGLRGLGEATLAVTVGRGRQPVPREGLWTRPDWIQTPLLGGLAGAPSAPPPAGSK